MSAPATNNTRQTAFVCASADKITAEKISLGLAGIATFSIECGAISSGAATHYGLVVHSTDDFRQKLGAAGFGVTPQPVSGIWEDYGLTDTDILPTVAGMFISDMPKGTDRIEQIDALLADNGLVRIEQEITEPV